MTEAEKQSHKIKALQGDGKEAMRLSTDPKLSDKERLYWYTIAAEDGFGPGMIMLGSTLGYDDSDPLNLTRARYWLNIAKSKHVRMADYQLCVIDKIENPTLPDCILPFENSITH